MTLLPEGDFDHDAGLALTAAGADRVVGDVHDAALIHSVAFDSADGVDVAAAHAQLKASGLVVLFGDRAFNPRLSRTLAKSAIAAISVVGAARANATTHREHAERRSHSGCSRASRK